MKKLKLAFTCLDLEAALVQRVTEWVADIQLKSPFDRGQVLVPLQVFQGAIPSHQTGPEAPMQAKAPAVAIRCSSASWVRQVGEACINFAILTWDDNLNRQGYQDILNIANRIVSGLQERVVINKAFVLLDHPIHFDEILDPAVDFFPFHLGLVTAHFGLMSYSPDYAPYGVLSGNDVVDVGGFSSAE